MKYMLFAFDCYYPGGGFSDLKAIVDTKEELKDRIKTSGNYGCDIIQVATITGKHVDIRAEYLTTDELVEKIMKKLEDL